MLVYALTEIALAAIVQFHPKNFDAKIAVEETKITHLLFFVEVTKNFIFFFFMKCEMGLR